MSDYWDKMIKAATEQQEVFPFEPKKLARNTDPQTSHEAAAQSGSLRGHHHRKIIAALRYYGDGTPYQIAEWAGMEVAAVFRRLNELQKAGAAVPIGEAIGPTNRKCRVWKAL